MNKRSISGVAFWNEIKNQIRINTINIHNDKVVFLINSPYYDQPDDIKKWNEFARNTFQLFGHSGGGIEIKMPVVHTIGNLLQINVHVSEYININIVGRISCINYNFMENIDPCFPWECGLDHN